MNAFYQIGIMFSVGAIFGTLAGFALYFAQKKDKRALADNISFYDHGSINSNNKKEIKKTNEKLRDNNKNKKQKFMQNNENLEKGLKAYFKRGLLDALQEKEAKTGLGQLSNSIKRKISQKLF